MAISSSRIRQRQLRNCFSTCFITCLTCIALHGALVLQNSNSVLGVEIKRVSLPSSFDATSGSDILLDCDYVYNENDFKLVVRWFYNSTPEPIYQWIPERNRRVVADFLKPFFDEQFEANPNDPYTKFRAIRIKQPTPALSGKYVCDISSLASQDKRETFLFIYASPRTFDFRYALNKETGDLHLECTALGVHPRPSMSLSQQDADGQLRPLEGVDVNFTRNGSLFDAVLKYTVTEAYLVGATATGLSTKFECSLELPQPASVVRRKRISLYPNSASLLTEGTISRATANCGQRGVSFVLIVTAVSLTLVRRWSLCN